MIMTSIYKLGCSLVKVEVCWGGEAVGESRATTSFVGVMGYDQVSRVIIINQCFKSS